jgi:hypothetical protein
MTAGVFIAIDATIIALLAGAALAVSWGWTILENAADEKDRP